MAGLGHMGKTSYHLAMDAVIDHYLDSGSTDPALVVFQTDGGPINKLAAERYLCKAAKLPLFWQFIGFGDPDSKQFEFLRNLTSCRCRRSGSSTTPVSSTRVRSLGRSPTPSCTTGSWATSPSG